jgi:hypothetical protein
MTERMPRTACGRVHIGPLDRAWFFDRYVCFCCRRSVTISEHEAYLKTHYEVIQIMTRAILESREGMKPGDIPPLRRLP